MMASIIQFIYKSEISICIYRAFFSYKPNFEYNLSVKLLDHGLEYAVAYMNFKCI